MVKLKEKIKQLSERRLVRSFLIIFTGQGLSSILGLFAILIIVQGIGSANHGIIVMAQTYVTMFFSLFSFKTFQALIKYLTNALKNNDKQEARIFIKWAFILDISSLIFAFFFGLLLEDLVIGWMGWNLSIKPYVTVFMFTILFNIQGSTVGILRTFEKYNYVVMATILGSFLRVLGWGICLFTKQDIWSYFLVEIMATISTYIMEIICMFITLKKNDLLDFWKVKLKFKKDFLIFNLYSNLASSIDLPINQITQFIINKYLGFAANSVYSVFERLGTIINKLGDPINQIIYPEMNILISNKEYEKAKSISDKLKKLMAVVFLVVAVGVLLTNKIWLGWFMDNPGMYLFSFILYLLFISYANGTAGVHNLFLALGYIKYTIPILLVINVIYLVFIFFAVQTLGLNGIIMAYLIQAFGVVFVKERILKRHKYKEYERKQKNA